MDYPFQRLSSSGPPMPIVPVSFPQIPSATFFGLVDSGAAGTRIPIEVATELGIDLTGASVVEFVAGGRRYTSLQADVELTVGKVTRPTRVSFVHGWQPAHFLLGMVGFFEHFVVRIEAAKETTRLTPSRSPNASR